MSMHPHSSALLREMELASEADRQLTAQRRLLLGDAPPPPQTATLRAHIAAAMGWFGSRLRHRAHMPRARQTVEPSGS